MFRRSGKIPLEKEEHDTQNFLYGSNKNPVTSPNSANSDRTQEFSDAPPRIFDLSPSASNDEKTTLKSASLSHPLQSMLKEETPETTLGENVVFRGELSFEKLLRIDGTFEGELLSQGKVIVGPKGRVKANLNLREAIIEGKVEGNLTIQEKLELRGTAAIFGDIRAKGLIVDEGVTIIGYVEITPQQQETTPESTTSNKG